MEGHIRPTLAILNSPRYSREAFLRHFHGLARAFKSLVRPRHEGMPSCGQRNMVIRSLGRPGNQRSAGHWCGRGCPEPSNARSTRSCVVGFDDIPAAKLITPRLTTVHQPMAEKRRLAVSMLLKEKVLLRTRLPAKLILRQTTDPAILRADQETEISLC
jgi:hypothetical protein